MGNMLNNLMQFVFAGSVWRVRQSQNVGDGVFGAKEIHRHFTIFV